VLDNIPTLPLNPALPKYCEYENITENVRKIINEKNNELERRVLNPRNILVW